MRRETRQARENTRGTGIIIMLLLIFLWNYKKQFILLVAEELKDRDNGIVSMPLKHLIN
jgi:hypothetical protein